MNEADAVILKELGDEGSRLMNIPGRVVYRDSEVLMFLHATVFTIWYPIHDTPIWSDQSPKVEHGRSSVSEIFPMHESHDVSRFLGVFPICVPWRELRVKGLPPFGSILLFPSGLRCSSTVRNFSVLKRDRLGLAVLNSENSVVVFVEGSQGETPPFGSKSFVVQLFSPVNGLRQPNSISFIASETESLFITDASSDQVLEFRFTSSILATVRKSADVSMKRWFLESGIPVNERCRLSFDIRNDGWVFAQIVGVGSNGDSQGLVQLMDTRESYFAGSRDPSPVFRRSCEYILGNCGNHVRITTLLDFDFPIFIQKSVDSCFATSWMGEPVFIVLASGAIRLFRIRTNRVEALNNNGFLDVKLFSATKDEQGKCILIAYWDGSDIRLTKYHIELDTLDIPSVVIGSVHDVVSLSVRAPVNGEDCVRIAYADHSGRIMMYPSSENLPEEPISVCHLSHEYLFMLSQDARSLVIRSLIPCLSMETRIQLPCPTSAKSEIKTTIWRGFMAVIIDSIIVVRTFNALEGIVWILVTTFLDKMLIELTDDELFSFDTLTGQISRHKIPDTLWSVRSSTYSVNCNCILQECLTLSIPNSPEWYTLASDVRSDVEELISPNSSDMDRSCDFFAKRFLISFVFTKAGINLTSEDLAWAAMSDSQPFIVAKLLKDDPQWSAIKACGLGYWCSESGLVKDMAEKMQKSCLQEYMRTKEPVVLDEKLAIWLALLGKQQLLASLYKQHGSSCASPVHTRIAQFFLTDFSIPENATKGIKNAFELVRQKRFGLAIAVFVFAGAYQEAVDICCRQMEDVQLGLVVLRLLRLRVGADTDRIDDIFQQVWRVRIVDPCIEAGDIWLPLVFAWLRKDVAQAMRYRELFFSSVGNSVDATTIASLGNFLRFKRFTICYPSVVDFIRLFGDACKRLNRPVPEDIVAVSEQERLYTLYATGCSQFALTSPKFGGIDPILKWAIHDRLMLPRSDTSTS